LTIVSDGREAVDAIQCNDGLRAFDIVLMDMQMPNLNGYEATRQLRQAGYHGWIIAITAAAMAGDAQRCLEAGCDAYVTKPFVRKELINNLNRFLQRGRPPK
jgi:CheY-like chemotaxis protein